MNIFWLDNDPVKCAEYHCDKHVVKMIVEYTQLMSSAVRLANAVRIVPVDKRKVYVLDGERMRDGKIINPKVYLATHLQHPCSVWVCDNLSNYMALRKLALALCKEYTKRYGKVHKCESIIQDMPRPKLPRKTLTKLPQAMPDEYKSRSAVKAYRNYYIGAKSRFAEWRHTKVPAWFRKDMR